MWALDDQLHRLLDGSLHTLLVGQVAPPEASAPLVAALQAAEPDEQHGWGARFGIALPPDELDTYLTRAASLVRRAEAAVHRGAALPHRAAAVFGTLATPRFVDVPTLDDGAVFAPYTVERVAPGQRLSLQSAPPPLPWLRERLAPSPPLLWRIAVTWPPGSQARSQRPLPVEAGDLLLSSRLDLTAAPQAPLWLFGGWLAPKRHGPDFYHWS